MHNCINNIAFTEPKVWEGALLTGSARREGKESFFLSILGPISTV
jgi:hypothetical protein